MKSFHLLRHKNLSPPRHSESNVSAETQSKLREAFRPIVHKHRQFDRLLGVVIGIFAGWILLSPIWATRLVVEIGFGVCLLGLAVLSIFTPKLCCPNCGQNFGSGFGPFCPECGNRSLHRRGWLRSPKCSVCGEVMASGKHSCRFYVIRACTHCGVWLDDKGL